MKPIIRGSNNACRNWGLRLGAWTMFLAVSTIVAATFVPLKAKLRGILLPLEGKAFATGVGTMTGAFVQEMFFTDDPLDDGVGGGFYVQMAASGDSFQGLFTVKFISASEFVGTWTVTMGTGRFEGATGSGTSSGALSPDLTFDYQYEGLISSVGQH